jgi:hypothetical protein
MKNVHLPFGWLTYVKSTKKPLPASKCASTASSEKYCPIHHDKPKHI